MNTTIAKRRLIKRTFVGVVGYTPLDADSDVGEQIINSFIHLIKQGEEISWWELANRIDSNYQAQKARDCVKYIRGFDHE